MELNHMEMQYQTHSVGYNIHHIEWCTKCRYKMFRRPEFMNVCEAAIRHAAERHGIIIRELTVLPEHVHGSIALPPTTSQARAEQLLKGGSAYEVFRAIPDFRKRYPRGELWSRGTMIKSVGEVTMDVVDDYVRGQYAHHGLPNPAQAPLSTFV